MIKKETKEAGIISKGNSFVIWKLLLSDSTQFTKFKRQFLQVVSCSICAIWYWCKLLAPIVFLTSQSRDTSLATAIFFSSQSGENKSTYLNQVFFQMYKFCLELSLCSSN